MEDVSIFPFIEVPEELQEDIDTENELPLAREYAWDFEKQDFKYENGKMYIVEGNEAIKIWLWKLFKTPRYRYIIYSWDYGSEFEGLIGQGITQGYIKSEAERYVKEAIEYNLGAYVTDVQNLEVSFINSELYISATLTTPYGEVDFVA